MEVVVASVENDFSSFRVDEEVAIAGAYGAIAHIDLVFRQ
jgi:hypothetical protein